MQLSQQDLISPTNQLLIRTLSKASSKKLLAPQTLPQDLLVAGKMKSESTKGLGVSDFRKAALSYN